MMPERGQHRVDGVLVVLVDYLPVQPVLHLPTEQLVDVLALADVLNDPSSHRPSSRPAGLHRRCLRPNSTTVTVGVLVVRPGDDMPVMRYNGTRHGL
ncbi:hypothetical protein C5613_27210 [Rhodococcus opacus]|uniref:Uncharacterized protein n=1 Tax=Rhodococcus opacus TaxID=37919 RepID=A0A2S8J1B7_RHOOP|nr:hypothetical protein C5613_27210 [Rhodococcus opacus]